MDRLKVCFIGIGSIAKRHIRNLREICEYRGISLTVDAFRRHLDQVAGVDWIYINEADLPFDYDAIFITNPTDQHLETLKTFHNHGKHFFIEKPVVSREQIEEAKQFGLKSDSVYYVAAPLRYNAVIQWIKNNVDPYDVISVRSISSSYLPDWRSGQDYRQTYSAHKDMGGGVSIDLIHEWDYLTYLFGWPERVSSMIGRKSDLEIDSDDYAIYIAEFANMIAELHLDYFGRKTIREIELFTKDDTILGDIANNKITSLRENRIIDFHEERDDFQKRELLHFIRMFAHKADTENGYAHGLKVLELTQGRL
jgi:predicted dehydrogenase